MEPVWREVATLSPGEYVATCAGAERSESAAGNKCVRWTFRLELENVDLALTTVIRRVETGRTAQALGLALKPLDLSKAAGRRCRIQVAKDGSYTKITAVKPL